MAAEAKRGCGYRKVGGLYLVGGGQMVECDRLPVMLCECEVCGQTPRPTRSIAKFKPFDLWGDHIDGRSACMCFGCDVCSPSASPGFLMWVGAEHYSPESFMEEAQRLGVSRRLPRNGVPKDLVIGASVVYLAFRSMRFDGVGSRPAVFTSFVPRAVEKIITQSQSEDPEFMADLEAKGYSPVVVPDNDPDHA